MTRQSGLGLAANVGIVMMLMAFIGFIQLAGMIMLVLSGIIDVPKDIISLVGLGLSLMFIIGLELLGHD